MNWLLYFVLRVILLIVLFIILHVWKLAEYLHVAGGMIVGVPRESMRIGGSWLSKDYYLKIEGITRWRVAFIRIFPYLIGYPTLFTVIIWLFSFDPLLPYWLSPALISALTVTYSIMVKCEFMSRFLRYSPKLDSAMNPVGLTDLLQLVNDIVDDCIKFIEKKEGAKIPISKFILCPTSQSYRLEKLKYGVDSSDYGIAIGTISGKRVAIINLEPFLKLLGGDNPRRNFLFDITCVVMEELLHVLSPGSDEREIESKASNYAEDFLGISMKL